MYYTTFTSNKLSTTPQSINPPLNFFHQEVTEKPNIIYNLQRASRRHRTLFAAEFVFNLCISLQFTVQFKMIQVYLTEPSPLFFFHVISRCCWVQNEQTFQENPIRGTDRLHFKIPVTPLRSIHEETKEKKRKECEERSDLLFLYRVPFFSSRRVNRRSFQGFCWKHSKFCIFFRTSLL